jgi:ABC-type polysaccharide/polyol phosphate export permease
MSSVGHLFVRVVNPMFSFGGWVYTWKTAHQMSPAMGYLHLLNPLIYAMEGMRSAALGQEGFLPFWFSFGAISAITLVLGFDAIRRLKKRLDCV